VAARAVLDASVLVRAAVQASTDARSWLEAVETDALDGHVPELAYAEVGSALAKYVRAGAVTAGDAGAALDSVTRLPLHAHRLGDLAPAALARALETELTVYDCCYAVLAEALEARLVTADTRLAAAVDGAELLDR
jgi:predicted nucleic acid-binding protein